MATQGNDRREFLKMGGAALATTAVSWNATSYAAIVGANDRVRVGIVGFGDRMKGGDIPAFQQHAKEMNFEIRGRIGYLEPEARGRRCLSSRS